MPELDDKGIEKLVRDVVAGALSQTLSTSAETTKHAVDRAVRDASIDRDLRDHESHLRMINGSQEAMARSLKELEKSFSSLAMTFQSQAKVQEALAKGVRDQQERGLTRWQIWVAALMLIAAYGSIVAILVTNG